MAAKCSHLSRDDRELSRIADFRAELHLFLVDRAVRLTPETREALDRADFLLKRQTDPQEIPMTAGDPDD